MSTNTSLLTPATMRAHRARWFVWAGGEKLPHTAQMRGTWGYDVACSCGQWASSTGGGTRACVASELWDHRYEAQSNPDATPDRRCPHDNHELLRQEDEQYICPKCGDEWHEDHFRDAV